MKNFLSINECSAEQLKELLDGSRELKKLYKGGGRDLCLCGKSLAMLFEKPSLRTRMSFQVAMTDLGGNAIYVKPEDIGGIGKREPVKDMARVLSRYVDGIMARTFEHSTVTELAKFATVPVINALTDWSHPCQAMADVLTISEHCGQLKGVKIAFVGDGIEGTTVMWVSRKGICRGSNGGAFKNLTAARYEVPDNRYGAGFFRLQNGIPQYIASLWT